MKRIGFIHSIIGVLSAPFVPQALPGSEPQPEEVNCNRFKLWTSDRKGPKNCWCGASLVRGMCPRYQASLGKPIDYTTLPG